MFVFDAHNHAFWHGHDIDAHVRNMDECDIDMALLLTWEVRPEDSPPTFIACSDPRGGGLRLAGVVEARRAYPDRFAIGFCPDPAEPDAIDRLEAAMEIHGVRACGEWKYRMMFDNIDNLRLLRFCAERSLPVTIHIGYPGEKDRGHPRPDYWYLGGMEALERALQAVPDVTIFGHGPGFWATISGDGQEKTTGYPKGPIVPDGALVRMMRAFPNLMGDMSATSGHNALTRDLEFTKDFLLEFQDRVLHARDYFDTKHRDLIDGLDLPDDVRAKILGGNAARMLNVDVPA